MKKRIENEAVEHLSKLFDKTLELFPKDKHKGVAYGIMHAVYVGLGRLNPTLLEAVIEDVNRYASFMRKETSASDFSELVGLLESLLTVVEDYEPKKRGV